MSVDWDALAKHDEAMTAPEWFSDYGKIGAKDSGIGEMDCNADAAGLAALRNALPAILADHAAKEARIAELEAALRDIVNADAGHDVGGWDGWRTVTLIGDIARAALSPQSPAEAE